MLVDLGSGDGAIGCEAAQQGFRATGVELNPMLAWFSKLRGISQAGATINLGDMWKQPVSDADVVVVYGVESEDFQQRLTTKLDPNLSALEVDQITFDSNHFGKQYFAASKTLHIYTGSTPPTSTPY